ncbi:hypothetical protein KBD75_02790 [Candidatus Woesebacteria bacterium]|nr:hypothetical protein [Candidatus Woesebacteria bacterium]
MANLGFERTLVVATHGIVSASESFRLSLKGVAQTYGLVHEVGKLLPFSENVLVVSEAENGYLRETAEYFAKFYHTAVIGLASLNLENSGVYALDRETAVLAELAQYTADQNNDLVVVTNSQMSDWLSGHIHKYGRAHLKLRESRAYITKPNGATHVADFDGVQWWSGSRT